MWDQITNTFQLWINKAILFGDSLIDQLFVIMQQNSGAIVGLGALLILYSYFEIID